MKDQIIKGTGNSRYLRSSVPEGTTWAAVLEMLRAGTMPIDFNGINPAGIEQAGTPLNKLTLLPDAVADAVGLDDTATVADVLRELIAKPGEIRHSLSDPGYGWLAANGQTIAGEQYPALAPYLTGVPVERDVDGIAGMRPTYDGSYLAKATAERVYYYDVSSGELGEIPIDNENVSVILGIDYDGDYWYLIYETDYETVGVNRYEGNTWVNMPFDYYAQNRSDSTPTVHAIQDLHVWSNQAVISSKNRTGIAISIAVSGSTEFAQQTIYHGGQTQITFTSAARGKCNLTFRGSTPYSEQSTPYVSNRYLSWDDVKTAINDTDTITVPLNNESIALRINGETVSGIGHVNWVGKGDQNVYVQTAAGVLYRLDGDPTQARGWTQVGTSSYHPLTSEPYGNIIGVSGDRLDDAAALLVPEITNGWIRFKEVQ